ncbi:hypothetical protein LTR86_000828 [Recurvomyces mirabilis]|nr:hypothetical protein LTR86_000828 [Recurvomyces mirabilis]
MAARREEDTHHENAILSIPDDPNERRALFAALDSFRQYRRAAHYNITHLRRQAFYSLPADHIDLLCEPRFSIPKTFDAVDEAIDSNAEIAEAILASGLTAYGLSTDNESWKGAATPNDMDKARSTIRQLYRDWSDEGSAERYASHSPFMAALEKYLPLSQLSGGEQHRILVPGAGLGRLVFEISLAGYAVEGNEISYHQLLTAHYMLNCTHTTDQHRLFPWALNFNNHLTRAGQLQGVGIPDIHPAEMATQTDVSHGERMSMTAGDFCAVYKQPRYAASFNAVLTCFFIDTAPNVLNYFGTIRHCLVPGGIWINLGPLLWHFEAAQTPAERALQADNDSGARMSGPSRRFGMAEPGSVELTNEEVLALVSRMGFDIFESEQMPAGATGYTQDPFSMLQNVYRPVFWTARKR